MSRLCFCAFYPMQPAAFRPRPPAVPPRSVNVRVQTPSAALSYPFPISDVFSFPAVSFINTSSFAEFRPELLGACLWTAGLYLGFSQKERWGTSSQNALQALLVNILPPDPAELIAAFLHSLPFLVAGFSIDAVLRYANGSSAVWAVASGLSVAMYGGIYELGRLSGRAKKVGEEDQAIFNSFSEFAERRLVGKGRCHLIDIRDAALQDPQARRIGYLTDETLRRFVRNKFPKAVRSPNGYYRGLSIREENIL